MSQVLVEWAWEVLVKGLVSDPALAMSAPRRPTAELERTKAVPMSLVQVIRSTIELERSLVWATQAGDPANRGKGAVK